MGKTYKILQKIIKFHLSPQQSCEVFPGHAPHSGAGWKMLDKGLPILMLLVTLNLSFPHFALAEGIEVSPPLLLAAGKIEVLKNYPAVAKLPFIEVKPLKITVELWVTAYNSTNEQTDVEPCITASGLNVCERNIEDIVATNFQNLPFGTRIRFPELFGDKVFTVHDRMHPRYFRTADIWMKDYQSAKAFGRKWTEMEILPSVIE